MSEPTADGAAAPETLEALTSRHRKEQRDLVSRVTQKKKQATKRTRKGVNDECERLEQELKERQAVEAAALSGEGGAQVEHDTESPSEDDTIVSAQVDKLSINGTATPTASENSSSGAPKKKNRQKERLARRKAEQDAAIAQAEQEAANAPNPRELERQRFEPVLADKNLQLHEIRADGHCLYAAVADQLSTRNLDLTPTISPKITTEGPAYKRVRYAAAGWIEGHKEDFEPFMEDPLPEHVRKIRETGEWGGHLELLALAKSYGVRICVLHSDGRVDKIEDEGAGGEKEEIWLGYYRHSHGLGEHYNSLRKVAEKAGEA
ncbi:OTU protein [Neodidymelliopsis sp. IMI 364377]|nr:OTU protein [Neodidymelliopsis sp. IMI 364377]